MLVNLKPGVISGAERHENLPKGLSTVTLIGTGFETDDLACSTVGLTCKACELKTRW